MERSLRRRSFLAAVGAVSLAGCTALGDSNGNGDLEDDDRDDQEASSDAIDPHGSTIRSEGQLLEIRVRRWTEVESIEFVDGDQLREIEPEREFWSQLTVAIDDLRETDVSNRLETPEPDAVDGAVIATGEVLEPVASYDEIVDGLSSRDIRDDVKILAKGRDPYQGDTTWISPLFDSPVPADEIAVDVAPLLERDEEIWLRPG